MKEKWEEMMQAHSLQQEKEDYDAFMTEKWEEMMQAHSPQQEKEEVTWWKRVTFDLLTLAMVQSYILYSKTQVALGRKRPSLVRFTYSLIHQLSVPENAP
jgi:hypothetical protein